MVAVTGANGLLGSFIVRTLIERKIPFVALKRQGSDVSLLEDVSSQVTWRDADIMNPVQLEDAMEGITRVIHTAAIVSFNPRKAATVMDINVQGTRNLINECLARGVERFVHISSVAALGRLKNQAVIDESNQWVDSPLHSVYARSKYQAELEVFRAQEEGLSTVIINPSVILAPGDWHKSSAQLFKYVWNENKFYTDAYLNYVDVRDVAGVTVRLLDENISAQRLIVNAGKISFHDFFHRVAVKFNKRAPSRSLNKTLLDIAARAEVFRTWFTGEEPLLTRETARLAGTNFLYDNSLIRKSLSIDFQPIDATIDWCCQHYLTKYPYKK